MTVFYILSGKYFETHGCDFWKANGKSMPVQMVNFHSPSSGLETAVGLNLEGFILISIRR